MELTWQAKYQLWLLYGRGEEQEQIRVRYAAVQQQKGGVDCGPFALAFAYDFLMAKEPSTASFTAAAIRQWIGDSFVTSLNYPSLEQ